MLVHDTWQACNMFEPVSEIECFHNYHGMHGKYNMQFGRSALLLSAMMKIDLYVAHYADFCPRPYILHVYR